MPGARPIGTACADAHAVTSPGRSRSTSRTQPAWPQRAANRATTALQRYGKAARRCLPPFICCPAGSARTKRPDMTPNRSNGFSARRRHRRLRGESPPDAPAWSAISSAWRKPNAHSMQGTRQRAALALWLLAGRCPSRRSRAPCGSARVAAACRVGDPRRAPSHASGSLLHRTYAAGCH